MTIIEIRNVQKKFKGMVIFDNLNITFEKGKIYGIIGHNGSGKSVLFKMICGFLYPNSGSIIVNGKQIGKEIVFPDNFGIIIDRPGYIGNKSGFDNLKSLALIQNKITDKDIEKAMKIVGLQIENKQKVKNYSLGMKQKLAIAQAIMENQSILILDEPFNALDYDSVINIRNLLKTYREEGKTILLTSHNKEDIDELCDEILRIRNNKLEKIG